MLNGGRKAAVLLLRSRSPVAQPDSVAPFIQQ
jgi:hypothetical protein